jgi:hypothetical protein
VTGVDLAATDRAIAPPASEGLAERRKLHELRLTRAADDVKRYRYVGGVRFIDVRGRARDAPTRERAMGASQP